MDKTYRILTIVFLVGFCLVLPSPTVRAAAPALVLQIPGYEKIAENDLFILYANLETLAFKVEDKRNGYIWHSNLDEKAADDRLNRTWTAFAQSGISIDYLDEKAIPERASITNAERTIAVNRIEQGFEAQVMFTQPAIGLTVIVQLEPAGVKVEVPFSSIQENNPDFKLGVLHLYPFFGATRADQIPGYMFIPDGSGSLIRFQAETKAQNMFYGRYYGPDMGMLTSLPWDPTTNRAYQLSIPVTGMAHEATNPAQHNAYIAIVSKGASYAEVQAHPSGIITNFNFLYTTFQYNDSYFQATNRSGAGVTTLQPNTNAFDIQVHYRFLAGSNSDYVGMAQSYQEYLIENGQLNSVVPEKNNIGIRLEFLGGEKEKILFWYRLIRMTTISEIETILADLNVQYPEVVYYGWQPLGAASMPPATLKVDRRLGTVHQLQTLAKSIAEQGGSLSLYLDPQAALYWEKGYSARNELAMSITNANLLWYNRNKSNYYFNYESLRQRYTNLSQDVLDKESLGLALDGIGYVLYSDFKRGHQLNREEAIISYQNMLAETPGRLSFYIPNDYMFGQMAAYYDIPLGDSGYLYTTETVPFLQIVLSGHVPYYGPALNFTSNTQEDLLRHADFGVYPSYFLTQQPTALILNTSSNWIYTSSYTQWREEIEATYAWLNALLGPVRGQPIIARQALAAGVMATTYANGEQIVVNYTAAPMSLDGATVNGKDAIRRTVEVP